MRNIIPIINRKSFNVQLLGKLLLALMILLTTTNCRFIQIAQPATVQPGETITVQLTVAIDLVPEPNPHKGVLAVLLPRDWSVLSAEYHSPVGSGGMEVSAAWTDSAQACYPPEEFGPGMRWVGLLSDSGYTYTERFNIDITLRLQAGSSEGCFNLGYLATKATPDLICSGNPAWAPLAYPHPVAVTRSGEVCDTAVVERAGEWDDLLDRRSGWTGADGIYSIPLSGREVPGNSGEQTLLLFSDTFIGEVDNSDRRLGGWQLVNNTYAYLDGPLPREENIEFFWDSDANDQPQAVFEPATANTQPGDWYWLMDGLALDDSVYVFGLRMERGDGGVFNFKIAGVSLISFSLTADHRITAYHQVDAPIYYRNEAEGWEIVFGQAIMPMTAPSANPGADGYIYVYGPRSFGSHKELVAARVLPEQLRDFSAWRFWNGREWSAAIADCAPLTEGISQEFSVTPVGDKFYLVFQINNSVAVRIGDSPLGPFGFLNAIYEAPEPQSDPDVYVYNAKAHPHLSRPGELLISYNVNSFDFIDHINNADIYRPRFITLKLSQPPLTLAETEHGMPRTVTLGQNYPNPFNPTTTIPFELAYPARVELKIYTAGGEWVRTLLNGKIPAGAYRVAWDGKDEAGNALSSGVYFYRFRVGRHYWGHKMVLVR